MKAQIAVEMQTDKEGASANCTYFYFLDVIKKKCSRLKDGVWDLCSSMANDFYVQLFRMNARMLVDCIPSTIKKKYYKARTTDTTNC